MRSGTGGRRDEANSQMLTPYWPGGPASLRRLSLSGKLPHRIVGPGPRVHDEHSAGRALPCLTTCISEVELREERVRDPTIGTERLLIDPLRGGARSNRADVSANRRPVGRTDEVDEDLIHGGV